MIGGNIGGNLRGIMPTVMAIGFVPGMLFSPIIQKYLGKKKMTLLSFFGSMTISLLILFLVLFAYNGAATPYLMFVGIFLHNIFAALWTVTSPAMTADYCEYQQWKTGDRLDGYMSQYTQVFTTICGLFSAWLTSEILIKLGAENSVAYENSDVMRKVFIMWAILGVACGALAMIPFFFWDLTEKRQLEMTREIKIRAMQSKIEDNEFTQDDVKEALELGVLTKEQITDMGYDVQASDEEEPVLEAAADTIDGNAEK